MELNNKRDHSGTTMFANNYYIQIDGFWDGWRFVRATREF